MRKYFEKAHCKINLALNVDAKAPNGYHYVDMIMTTLKLHDEIEVVFNDGKEINIISTRPDVPTDENNICYKACMIMKEKFNLSFGADIFIKKNIPIAAGLGGGSANAAAVIKIIAKEFNINLKLLEEIYMNIGADVKFLMQLQTSRATNFGERLEKIESIPEFNVLLIKPKFDIYTKDVYNKVDSIKTNKRADIDRFIRSNKKDIKSYLSCYNVLQEVVEMDYPKIKEIIEYVSNNSSPILCMMSGSGPTVFALYDSEIENFYLHCSEYFIDCDVILTEIYN